MHTWCFLPVLMRMVVMMAAVPFPIIPRHSHTIYNGNWCGLSKLTFSHYFWHWKGEHSAQ
jgi:hypothetical protein